ncbi:probable bifunctional dTTP/UTP pyrophosphatase/methyltransferase protein isoform X2 [Lethenteron reissneri]|nr:probable bifunctional dTTP/UTP pyrophosphatase/methyltransferase protein isoform X2 [Lethenteron reissneri]XP_061431913.1 probable bifunctional dTTP/UTP pyrophosphatase/methyltransferase protein isoform X2 [Lethenteron reissneri]
MLKPVVAKLTGKCVVLASASPRRRDILTNIGLKFEVVPSWYSEDLSKAEYPAPYAYATETAVRKALEVAKRMHERHQKTPDLVIGADTVVAIDGDILEKPADKPDAYRMLSRLSGREHSVFTGVALVECCVREGKLQTSVVQFHEETRVKFADLSEELLWEYIDSGEPMDKAGGYGIQALGGMFVESIHGDFPQCGGVAPPPRLPQVRRALQLRSCHTLSWRSCWACLCRAQWCCRVWGRRQKGDGPVNASSGASRGNGYVYLSTDPADVGSSSCCLPAYGTPLSLSPFCIKLKSIQFS